MRLGTVALSASSAGPQFPEGGPSTPAATPLLVYDALARAFPPRYDAGWSNFYSKYPRRPDLSHLVPPYVAERYQQVVGVGQIGWLREDDNTSSDPQGEPTPAWALGPSDAGAYEKERREGSRLLHQTRPQPDTRVRETESSKRTCDPKAVA